MALEEEFDTEILDEEAEQITTVQLAINYINENLANRICDTKLKGRSTGAAFFMVVCFSERGTV